ncbi:peptidoglycan DD-metalloendopeptidase family protein [Sphingopyxis macrogoltabida]|uniref:Peptidase M23 n=1 Tax=Sphingopyxis macrogoltabida TaxID=33050 RepID=A0AAC8Z107_SPHMC|nr:peptidoglycan DD-metalloendopeptidase family protein [Sphingopyxis macrogoltabida]ALJ12542.1 hypothetical protein LH19_06655 [Sphingopyxis macrogoltabida]AMU89983.1 hypothetical protein ATM17_13145 [Sphingopyxis macrogoltabida]
MTTRTQTDVSLVIRARDEASRAVTAIDDALRGLFDTQKQVASGATSVSSGFRKVITTLAGLDKAYARANAATDASTAATERQLSAFSRNQDALASYRKQLDAAKASQQRFNDTIGPKTEASQQRYALVGQEIKSLEGNIKSLERELTKQESQFQRSASSLREVARDQKLAGAVTTFAAQEAKEYARALDEQAAAAQRAAAAAALQANVARSTDSRGYKSAAASASVFQSMGPTSFEAGEARAAQAELNALASAGARLRGAMNPLAAIQDKLNRELAELPRVAKAAKFSAEELAAAEKLLRMEADRAAQAIGRQGASSGKPTLFGLKPYEMTNLGYQINDVVTQLASGTSLVQTMAQQGGQILQLFPRAGSAIVAALSNPLVLGFAATIGVIVAGIKEVGNEAERIRQFGGILGLNADGGDYNAQALNDASEALDRYGMSAEDAVATVKLFVKEGVNPAAIEEFGRAALDLADIMGVDLKDAAEQVATAFTGGYTQIKELDDAYNFLTATQREHIRTLFEEGRASEARTQAFEIFSGKVEETADAMRGPWAAAVRELSGAWREFIDWVSNTAPIAAAGRALEGLGKKVRELLKTLREGDRGRLLRENALLERDIADANKTLRDNPGNMIAKLARDASQRQLDLNLRELAKIDAAESKITDTVAKQAEARRKSTEGLKRETAAGKENKSAAEAEAEARRKATEFISKNFKLADEASKQAYIDQEVTKAREAAEKRITGEKKKQADETERQRKEAERLAKQTAFINPVDGRISSGFGMRKNPVTGKQSMHNGTDFAVPTGTAVKAPGPGTITLIAEDATNGKYVVIDHGGGVVSKMLHLSDNALLQQGDFVRQGDVVGKSGNTGRSTGAHLHWQITVNGKPVDSQKGMFALDGAQRFAINPGDSVDDFEKLTDQRNEKAEEFLRKMREENAERAVATIALREQVGLQGDALLAAQRQQAMAQAEADLREKFARFNEGLKPGQVSLELTQDMVDEVRELAGAYHDAANARDRFQNARTTVDRPVEELSSLRDQLEQRVAFYQERGQTGLANQLQPQLDAVIAKLQAARDEAIAFYQALTPGSEQFPGTREELDLIIQRLQLAGEQSQNLGYYMGIAGQQIAQTFANTATSAIDRFSQSVAEGRNVFGSLLDAFRQFAAEFLRQIAQMIIQQTVFNLVSGILAGMGGGASGGGSGGSLGVGLPGIKLHSGGVVGQHGTPITGNPAWYVNAVRYHTGGFAGLKPNEIPAILERGEEILTRGDPRHALNGGGAGEPPVVNIRNININDSVDQLDQALNGGSKGDRVMLNWIRGNSGAVKAAIG